MHLRLALNLAIVCVNTSFRTAFSTYPYKYASLNYAFLRGAFRHLSLSLARYMRLRLSIAFFI
jgi:hypothetical protein